MGRPRKLAKSIELTLRPGVALEPVVFVRARNAAQAVIDAASSEALLAALIAKAASAPKPLKSAGAKAKSPGRRQRIVLNPAKRAEAVKMFQTGATAATVAKAFNVSIATSNNIKRAAGLTAKRGKKKGGRKKKNG